MPRRAKKPLNNNRHRYTPRTILLTDWLMIGLCSLGLFVACYFLTISHNYQLFGRYVTRVDTSQKLVALTFDDGPEPVHTEQILGTLADKHVKATFYVIGVENVRHPDELKKIIAAGNDVGNHSYLHYPMVFWPQRLLARDIEANDALIRQAGYQGLITFRPPFSDKFIGLPWYLSQTKRITIYRDVAPDEVSPALTSASQMTQYTLSHTHPGSIILLHAMYDWGDNQRAAIGPIIDGLTAQGYKFVTISELLTAGHITT